MTVQMSYPAFLSRHSGLDPESTDSGETLDSGLPPE